MKVFERKHKKMAERYSPGELKSAHAVTERALMNVSKNFSSKKFNKIMAEHRDYEYAMLYQQTPKFQKKLRKRNDIQRVR